MYVIYTKKIRLQPSFKPYMVYFREILGALNLHNSVWIGLKRHARLTKWIWLDDSTPGDLYWQSGRPKLFGNCAYVYQQGLYSLLTKSYFSSDLL